MVPGRYSYSSDVSSRHLQQAPVNRYDTTGHLVNAPDSTCDEMWTSWPDIQEKGLVGKNVLVINIFPSVGNLFIVLEAAISVSMLLATLLRLIIPPTLMVMHCLTIMIRSF